MITDLFRIDQLSLFIGTFVIFFFLLTFLYSLGFLEQKKEYRGYFLCITLTALTALGTVFADNWIVFILCWGFLGLLLYLLIQFRNGSRAAATAQKTLIIIAGTDAFMVLGVAIIVCLTGSFSMSKAHLALDNGASALAFLCLLMGAFAKAGVLPFHTWVPDMAQDADAPTTAFLPASLDKLLGIYLFYRLSLEVFEINNMVQTLLMAVGCVTILAAVMMALVQHDMKRMLGYHAVSQVGYMILGISSLTPVGIAGGMFHMLNHAIYKSCLFFSAGTVELKFRTTDLDRLGGVGREMPLTFMTFGVASLAISGVPPFNGFVSKWMIYQGLIEQGKVGSGSWWILGMLSAFFGGALTLASFMKLLHAVFLGQPSPERPVASSRTAEAPLGMLAPGLLLAVLCVLFGIFAYSWPLSVYIYPALQGNVTFPGIWESAWAIGLIGAGLVIGLLIYSFGRASSSRSVDAFVGGEKLDDNPAMRLSGTGFYRTIEELSGLSRIYRLAKQKSFDLYEQGGCVIARCNVFMKYLHDGVLSTYLAWCVLGLIILLWVFL